MKTLRLLGYRLGALLGDAIILLVRLAALGLAPTRLGRLLASVSLPRYREHRLRTSLTVLGVALGVAVLVAVVLVNRSIERSVSATFDDIGGKAELIVTGPGGGFDESALERVTGVTGVAHATPVLEQTTLMRAGGRPAERLLVVGVEMIGDEDQRFRSYRSRDLDAIKEDPVPFLNSRSNLLVTRSLADRLGLRARDTIELATPRGNEPFTVWGVLDDSGLAKAFGGMVALMYYPAMQGAFARGDNVDRIDVAVAPGADPAEVSARLARAAGPGLRVERPERKNDRMLKMLGALRTGLTVGSLVALLVGMFLIYNTMAINVVQRRRELGVLRALGILRGQIVRLITLEGALLGGVGSALGLGLGIFLARVLLAHVAGTVSEIYLQVAAGEVQVGGALVAGGLVLGVAAAVLSSLVPALEAMRVQPVETLRTGSFVPSAPPRRGLTRADLFAGAMFVLAAALLRLPPVGGVSLGGYGSALASVLGGALLTPRAIGLVHLVVTPLLARLVGVEARLASDNLRRDLRRASITAGALMVGVAMTISVTIFVGSFSRSALDWIDQSIPADLHLTSGSRFAGMRSLPMEDLLYDELRAIPGIDALERVRVADLELRGTPIKILSTDTEVFGTRAHFIVLEGRPEGVMDAFRAGRVLVSENLARRFDLHPGSEITLPTPKGEAHLSVAAVVVDYTSDQGTVAMERELYAQLYGDRRVDTYKIYLQKGADLERVRSIINERYAARYNLFMMTYREFKASIVSLMQQVFGIMDALEVVAIIIAILGVINALLASVLDRVREIGVLRALGMRRRQVRTMIVTEGGLLGLCAVLVGLVAGLVLGEVLIAFINVVQSGWYFPYRPPWLEIAEACGLVVAVSAVAGYYPARAAANLVVTEALEYE